MSIAPGLYDNGDNYSPEASGVREEKRRQFLYLMGPQYSGSWKHAPESIGGLVGSWDGGPNGTDVHRASRILQCPNGFDTWDI